MAKRQHFLPISERPIPDGDAFKHQTGFLVEAGARSHRTERTYRKGLRIFADWLQVEQKTDYTLDDDWPLDPRHLTTATILSFRNWLLNYRARSTTTTYMAAVTGYLHYLDGIDQLPEGIQLGKLQRQMARRKIERTQSEAVIDLDIARQEIPRILDYYDDLPLPAENDAFNRRLTLLRNRAIVKVLFSTAARISEVVGLDRKVVGNGRSAYASIRGKGGKARTIHIRPYAQEAIQAYLAERTDLNPALFVSHSRNADGSRLSKTSVHKVVKKAVRALDLEPTLSAHDFRHYRATHLLREGMPLEVVQEYLGHTDIATTRNVYAPVLGVQVVAEWLDNLEG